MARIEVTPAQPDLYEVGVSADGTSTAYRVTATADDVARLGGGEDPLRLIRESFEYLDERGGLEEMPSGFSLADIAERFPDYPEEIRTRSDANTIG